jgi:large subunit ribosomal protein L29
MSVKKWLKQQKLRELSESRLHDRVSELKAEMFNHRFQRTSGRLENYRLIPQTRRRLAALQTILREKVLATERTKEASK